MLKRRLFALLLLLALLTGTAAAAGQPPYAIQVNRAANTVTIYRADENGAYTVPVKAMLCSTARAGHVTPLGSFRLAEYRSEWRLMLDGTYGQYATCFSGNYLFHSICYSDDSHDAMVRESYNKLGSPASMGCVRLETADAKWIYDNCPAGTPVTVYDNADDPGPLGKPERTIDEITEEMYNGWDPTDPAEGNPWRQGALLPFDDLVPGAWYYPELRQALDRGLFQGTAARTFSPNAAMTRAMVVQVLYNQAEKPAVSAKTAYTDVPQDAWYADAVAWAASEGIMQGVSPAVFAPDAPMTRQELATVLWRHAGEPKDGISLIAYADRGQIRDYAKTAMAWMVKAGHLQGANGKLRPADTVTRAETAAILNRVFPE